MSQNSANSRPQKGRNDSQEWPQFRGLAKVGDTVDLFSKRANLPVPYVPKKLTEIVRQTGYETDKKILRRTIHVPSRVDIDLSGVLDFVMIAGSHLWGISKILVPMVLAGGGVYVLVLGIYMVVSWAYFVHFFIGLVLIVFLILTVPQAISNSRRGTNSGTTRSDITIINNVSSRSGGRTTIINNINQD